VHGAAPKPAATGPQEPGELLAEIIWLCLPSQENNVSFNSLFLSKLPSDLRIHMSTFPMADKQNVAAQVDQLWAHKTRLAHDPAVAAVERLQIKDKLLTVAAVGSKSQTQVQWQGW